MMNGKSEKENRWVTTLLHHGGNPVWINGIGRKPLINSMLTKIDGFVGEEIGTLVYFDESAMVNRNITQRAVCHKSSVRVPFEDMMRSSELEFLLTSNLVQPDGTPEKPIVSKYHEYCKNVFSGSIAAYPDHVTQYLKQRENKEKIVHVAGQYKWTTNVQNTANSDCNSPLKTTVVRTRFVTAAEDGKEKAIDDTSYVNNYPNNKCADTVRSILTIHNGKLSGLVDEPAIARHRLLCVRGSKVALDNLASNRCGGRANPDGDYDCKCKEGYTDVHTISSFENKDSYRKGELCYKSNCKKIEGRIHVIVMIDIGYTEIGPPCMQAIEYFKQIPGLIPDTAKIDLIRWDEYATSYSFSSSNKTTEMEYELVVEKCRGFGSTNPMSAMTRAHDLFEQNESDIRILFSTTGGGGLYDIEWVQEKMIKKLQVNMIIVHYGDYEHYGAQLQDLINPDKLSTNYIRTRKGSKGMSKDHLEMVILQQCNPNLDEII